MCVSILHSLPHPHPSTSAPTHGTPSLTLTPQSPSLQPMVLPPSPSPLHLLHSNPWHSLPNPHPSTSLAPTYGTPSLTLTPPPPSLQPMVLPPSPSPLHLPRRSNLWYSLPQPHPSTSFISPTYGTLSLNLTPPPPLQPIMCRVVFISTRRRSMSLKPLGSRLAPCVSACAFSVPVC